MAEEDGGGGWKVVEMHMMFIIRYVFTQNVYNISQGDNDHIW